MKPATEQAVKESPSLDTRLQSDWSLRQAEFGNVPQAVLLRNLPPQVNELIDKWHRSLLRWILAPLVNQSDKWVADLGCGYGRMAHEAVTLGIQNVIGLDYEYGFCKKFQIDYGLAIRGSIAKPPFANSSISAAYSITSLMYIGIEDAARGLELLDDSLKPGSCILLLEAGSEFNRISRCFLRKKKSQQLAVNGLTRADLRRIIPDSWRIVASGSNAGTTALLPFLLLCNRWHFAFGALSKLALWIDRPLKKDRDQRWRKLGLHRWVACEKAK
ncbi:class I SAM-dependent methyltransferase [Thermomonas paludicola]|uniref:class I SAM-dependent methyltransferase n=1 Tax=Thermomonas paludicola TaxID=2884874 RepID=UPI0021150403|nr:class I SAM-dependent methyltransferase [Thermomonas paludicola]